MTYGSLMKVKGIEECSPWNNTLFGLIYMYASSCSSINNQATTKLAFHSNEASKDKLSIIYNWLSIIVIQGPELQCLLKVKEDLS